MSIELVARAKKTRLGGDSTAKLLLIVLADYANDEGMAWPSVKTMSEEIERSERSVQLLLRKLESMHLIRRGNQKLVANYARGRRPVVYRVFPKTHPQVKPSEIVENVGNVNPCTGETHFTPETDCTGETSFTPQVKSTSPHGRNPLHPTGETHFALGVKPTSPKPSHEPSIEPSRESTRAQQKPTDTLATRIQRLNQFTPTSEQQALADRIGVDWKFELDKFRAKCLADGKPPFDPKSAFDVWLARAREHGITRPPALPNGGSDTDRRAWKLLDSSTPIKRRQPDEAKRRSMVPAVSRLLAKGTSPVQIVDLIAHGDATELAEHGIEVDDMAAIA